MSMKSKKKIKKKLAKLKKILVTENERQAGFLDGGINALKWVLGIKK